jgi:recombination protein RecA
MNLSDEISDNNVEVTPTGIPALDIALGRGGLPLGRIVEMYGPESSGKTTVAMHVVAEAQSLGMRCAYIDSEHAFDPVYAEALGIDTDSPPFSQPGSAEEAFNIAEALIATGEIGVLVFDSVAAMTPRAEIEGEYGESHVGLHARIMSQALRKLTGIVSNTNTLVIFINQLREKVGVIYGSPEVTPGGRALKFYSSVRLDIRRIETKTSKEEGSFANRVRVKVVKNKVAKPFTMCEFDINFGEGVNKLGSLLDVAIDNGFVTRSGSWYYYEGEQIGQGTANAVEWIAQHPEVRDDIQSRLLAKAEGGND